jgi:hypothetical protein
MLSEAHFGAGQMVQKHMMNSQDPYKAGKPSYLLLADIALGF